MTPTLERKQSLGPQQSARARADTLVNFCRLMDQQRMAGPAPEAIQRKGIGHGHSDTKMNRE